MAVTELRLGELVIVGPHFDSDDLSFYPCIVTFLNATDEKPAGLVESLSGHPVWNAEFKNGVYVTSTGRDIAYPSEQELFEFQLSKLQSQDTD
ncbi:MAG: hypothetical protein E6R03_03290 [Hyphomicrobiaceae bacterium]|nr:MAG: hypothetical protein E6R03_03290 [Hyphomicrobiaceae bacterium]